LGIDRRIAYSHRKYHSSWMWVGVINELASIKFSGSIKVFWVIIAIIKIIKVLGNSPIISLIVKYGWNEIRSLLERIPMGLFDPLSWRKIKWKTIIMHIIRGVKKCKIKNRLSVGLLTANPPHNHSTVVFPI